MIRNWLSSIVCAAVVALVAVSLVEAQSLSDGDRIVLVGNTLIERDGEYGYLETRITSQFPEFHLSFRNLGWSGDTVWGEARAGFDTPAEGYQRLLDEVRKAEPTQILVAYGTNESFAGEAGLERFTAGLNRLLDDLSATGARLFIMSPPRQENLGAPLPDPTEQNRRLALYSERMRQIAEERELTWLDLNEQLVAPDAEHRLTYNGLHLSPYGYWKLADTVTQLSHLEPADWQVTLSAAGDVQTAEGTTVQNLAANASGLSFTLQDAVLPVPPLPAEASQFTAELPPRTLRITDLPAGEYELVINDRPVATATAAEWGAGVSLRNTPESEQTEQLRQAILKKNELFFHRWRPQNITYLFGFRKHEQGQNAAEVEEFLPLIAEQEQRISELRVPAEYRYELRRKDS